VPNAPTPPPTTRTVTFFEKQDAGGSAAGGRAGKIEIPEGYQASTATMQICMMPITGVGVIAIGGELHAFNGSDTQRSTLGLEEKEISVTISVKAEAWAAGVDVHCILSSEAKARWQQAAFDAIIAAYQRQLTEYNERKAQRELQLGSQPLGRNPLINRRVERDELKKWVIMMLTKNPDLNLDSFQPSPNPGQVTEPVIDLGQANNNGKFIRFLENAFEWQNMLYVFYPHMWGRRARWISALNITDPDPDFAAFLRAGAARVQVPVRPGFERAVAYFVHMGTIWEGNDVPLVDDDLYVPIIDEITSNLGKIEGGVPYPANSRPWEVTVPTDLVLVQDVSNVPPLRDALRPTAAITIDGEVIGDGGPSRLEAGKPEQLEATEASPTKVPTPAHVSDVSDSSSG
jgi:ribosome-associated translation inhibitor RaiA